MSSIGLRYERLLFWAAPITLAACIVFIATLGYNTQQERLDAICYEKVADLLRSKEADLTAQWLDVEKAKKDKKPMSFEDITYERDVSLQIIYKTPGKCWQLIKEQEFDLVQKPKKLIEIFISKSETLRKKPIKMYGVEIPDIATVSIIGTSIKIETPTFIQALQIALAPILLLWLGSLYHTRLREAISLKDVESILAVYPHVINVFPNVSYAELRKRSFWKYHAPTISASFYYIIRTSLLMTFIAPSVILYLYSLTYQPIFNYWKLNVFFGFWISLYALGLLLVETAFGKKHFKSIDLTK